MRDHSALNTIAERQLGLFTAAQAYEAGFNRRTLRAHVGAGMFVPAAPGVFRVAGVRVSWPQRVLAAVLAEGDDVGASHVTAASLWDVPGFGARPLVDVVKAHARNRRGDGFVVHGSRLLPPHHLRTRGPITLVSPARMLCEIAPLISAQRLERAVDNALSLELVTPLALTRTFEELDVPGRRGMAKLRPIVDVRGEGYVAPASELEALFLRLCEEGGFEEPVRQLNLGGDQWIGRVDMVWRRLRLVVELDGRRNHTALLDREADALRTARLTAAGWTVIRITWRMLQQHRDEVARLVRAALAAAA